MDFLKKNPRVIQAQELFWIEQRANLYSFVRCIRQLAPQMHNKIITIHACWQLLLAYFSNEVKNLKC